jgi:hypothetical protein
MVEIRAAKRGQIAEDHGRKKHVGLPARQGIPEACGRAERRRAGGKN